MNKKQLTISEMARMSQEITVDIFDIVGFNRPNSKQAYLELGAKIQANTLAFKLPTFDFKNSSVQKQWEKIIKTNKFLEIIQQLETNLYKFGIYALGIKKLSNNEFIFQLAEVSDYKIVNNKLVKLRLILDSFQSNNETYQLIKEYDLTKKGSEYVPIFAYQKQSQTIHSLSNFKDRDFSQYNEFSKDYIPWIVFKNNYLASSEIDDVDASLFQMLDNSLECLLRDNFWSNPFIFIVDNYNSDSANDVKKAVYDLSKRVIQANTLALNAAGSPIEFHQGNSNTQSILQKIDKLNYLIKDQMFFKMNSADFGTKNMHNAEFENLNSNFNDYVEAKANSREEYYYDFINLFFTVAQISKCEFEVIVPGSTKYLKSKEAIYNVDQNGIVMSPNVQPQSVEKIEVSKETESDNNGR